MNVLWSEFQQFLAGLNLVQMVTGMIISGAVSGLTDELISQLMKPVMDHLDAGQESDEETGRKGGEGENGYSVPGIKLRPGRLLNKLVLVLVNILLAFGIYLLFSKSLEGI